MRPADLVPEERRAGGAAAASKRSEPEGLELVIGAGADEVAVVADVPGQSREQRDVTILRFLPGVGRLVIATLPAEASEALHRRDRQALRCLSGMARITERSGGAASA